MSAGAPPPAARRPPIIHPRPRRTPMSTARHLGLKPSDPIEEFERIGPKHPVFRIVESNTQPPASSH